MAILFMAKMAKKRSGYLLTEVAPALWLAFIIFTVPMTTFGTLGMRYALLTSAVHSAACLGSRCQTFLVNTSPTSLSAVNMATQTAQNAAKTWSGITITQVNTYIAICPVSGGAVTRQSTALTSPANSSTNAYNFEVVLQAQLQPLITDKNYWLVNIPGLTGPLTTSARSDFFFENTQGLTQ